VLNLYTLQHHHHHHHHFHTNVLYSFKALISLQLGAYSASAYYHHHSLHTSVAILIQFSSFPFDWLGFFMTQLQPSSPFLLTTAAAF